jgi:transketolase
VNDRGETRTGGSKPVAATGKGPHFWAPALRDRVSSDAARSWNELRRRARLRLLRMHYESRAGHIGGNLSCLDLLLVLHHQVLDSTDRFVLSKGHAAGAYYVTLWTAGKLDDEDIARFHQDSTLLSGHPPASGIDAILFATGSLGHGLSLAAGLALARKLRSEPGRVICLTSDGEWNEGSCWEALIFARHQNLANLIVLVDQNGLQGFGTTRQVACLDPLAEKFRAFGVFAMEVDGHDAIAVRQAIETRRGGPQVIVARTRKGCGVSFMEGRLEWHYLPMNEDQYRQAVEETEQACETHSVTLSSRPRNVPSSSS